MFDPLAGPPPLPERGDDNRDTIFLGVGKIMSAWETIEWELARLYSVFAGDPDGPSMRGYGEPPVSQFRIKALSRFACEKYFTRHPCQTTEGNFDALIQNLLTLVLRRNEVAHGVVFNIEPITAFAEHLAPDAQGKPQYALISPYHSFKQHGPDGLPVFAYTRQTLEILFARMAKTHAEIERFKKSLRPL